MLITNCSLNLSEYFPAMKFASGISPLTQGIAGLCTQTLKSLDMHVEFNIFPHWK